MANWGTVFGIALQPTVDKRAAERQLSTISGSAAGRKAGQEFGAGFSRDSMGRLRDAHGRFVTESGLAGARAGKSAGTGMTRAMTPSFRQLASLAAKTLGPVAVVYQLHSLVTAAIESEQNLRLLNAVIKSTGGAANVSAKQVQSLVTRLSLQAGASQTAVLAGENMLLTFRGVRNEAGKGNDIFDQASQAILDMTAAMNGGSVSQEGMRKTAIRVGKALQDPIKGAGALRRVGVMLTDQQEAQIKAFVASGNTMAAQRMILAELKQEFGGAAAAMADPIERLRLTMRAWGVTVIKWMLAPVNRLVTFIQNTAAPAVGGFLRQAGVVVHGVAAEMARAFGPAVIGFLRNVAAFIRQVWSAAQTLAGVLAPVAGYMAALAGAAVIGALRALGSLLANTIGPALQAVAGFVRDNATWFQAFAAAGLAVWGAMVIRTLAFRGALLAVTVAQRAAAVAAALFNAVVNANPIMLIITALAALGAAFYLAWTRSATFRQVVIGVWNAVKGAVAAAWAGIKVAIDALVGAWQAVVGFFRSAAAAVVGVFSSIRDYVVGQFMPWWRANGQALTDVWRAMWGFLKAIFAPVWNAIVVTVRVGWALLAGAFRAGIGIVRALWSYWWNELAATARAVWAVVAAVARAAWGVIAAIFTAGWNVVKAIWSVGWTFATSVVRVAWAGIQAVIKVAWQIIVGLFTFFINLITGRWGAAWNALRNMFVGVWNAMAAFVRVALSAISNVMAATWAAVRAVAWAAWNGVKGVFVSVWGGIRGVVGGAVGWIKATLANAWAAIAGVAAAAWGGIKTAIAKVWDGIKAVVKAPVKWIADNVWNRFAGIVNTFTNFLGLGKPIPVLRLQHGGVVPGLGRGDRYPALLEAGETVVSRAHSRQLAPYFAAAGVPGYQWGGIVNAAKWVGGKVMSGVKIAGDWFKNLAYGALRATAKPLLDALTAGLSSMPGFNSGWGKALATLPKRLFDKFLNWLGGRDKAGGTTIFEYAKQFVGKVPYVWGGATPAGWDCSGFTSYVYHHFGIPAPRTSQEQQAWARPSADQPGALVFFYGRSGAATHVGLSSGTGRMIDAYGTGYGTRWDSSHMAGFSGFGVPPGGWGSARATGVPGGATWGGALGVPQLEDLWRKAGGPASLAHLMAAVAMAESGGWPTARNPSTGAAGLWQIYGLPFGGDPYDPFTNALMAVAKYRAQGLRAWEAYTNGSFARYLARGGLVTRGSDGAALPVRLFDRGGWLPPRSAVVAVNQTRAPEPVGRGAGPLVHVEHLEVRENADVEAIAQQLAFRLDMP